MLTLVSTPPPVMVSVLLVPVSPTLKFAPALLEVTPVSMVMLALLSGGTTADDAGEAQGGERGYQR